MGVWMKAMELDPAVPDVAIDVVGERGLAEGGHDAEEQGRAEGKAQGRRRAPPNDPPGSRHDEDQDAVDRQQDVDPGPQVAEGGKR